MTKEVLDLLLELMNWNYYQNFMRPLERIDEIWEESISKLKGEENAGKDN